MSPVVTVLYQFSASRVTEVACAWGLQICAAIAKQKRIQVAEALLEVPGGQVMETGAPLCEPSQEHGLLLHVMLDGERHTMVQVPETGTHLSQEALSGDARFP